MIFKAQGRSYYVVKFRWEGKAIQKRTRAKNAKVARQIEAQIRTELAKGNWGILEPKPPAPTLADFLKHDFEPFTANRFATKAGTAEYYGHGKRRLLASDMATLRLDEITNQHAAQYAARQAGLLSASSINCTLRTLRRALRLAEEWGKLTRAPRISLARGERQRERVLTDAEIAAYLTASPQPWRDMATLILGTGLRPGEVYVLRWENVLLGESNGLVRVAEGKTKAARRLLPLVPAALTALSNRWQRQDRPAEGWVFPAATEDGHATRASVKGQHAKAIERVNAAAVKQDAPKQNAPKLKPFEPYCLRHTALTRLAASGCDAFTLARIAGHSSITITQRYTHPQADAIEQAFARWGGIREAVRDRSPESKPAMPGDTRPIETTAAI